jgi:YHS domain-containing protein
MTISPADAAGHFEHKGHTYFFCAESCLEQFRADPERFLTGPAKGGPHVPKGEAAEWTCPMHPEVVRSEPGSCPICGMALEPRTITLDESNPELDDMTRRLLVSGALTVPTLLLAMSELLPGDLAHTGMADELDTARTGHASRALGRLAVLRPRLAVDHQPQPQHVHADRTRRRRRLGL